LNTAGFNLSNATPDFAFPALFDFRTIVKTLGQSVHQFCNLLCWKLSRFFNNLLNCHPHAPAHPLNRLNSRRYLQSLMADKINDGQMASWAVNRLPGRTGFEPACPTEGFCR
jgi:hypothetical protein